MRNGHQPRFKTAKLYLRNQIKAVMSSLKVILVSYSIICDGESSKLSTSIRIVTAYLTKQPKRILHGCWTLKISFIADTPRHQMCIHGTFTALDLLSWQSISEVVEEPRSKASGIHSYMYVYIKKTVCLYIYIFSGPRTNHTLFFVPEKKTFCKVKPVKPMVSLNWAFPIVTSNWTGFPLRSVSDSLVFLKCIKIYQNPLRPNGNESQSHFFATKYYWQPPKTAVTEVGTDCKSEDSSVFEKKTSPGRKQLPKVMRHWEHPSQFLSIAQVLRQFRDLTPPWEGKADSMNPKPFSRIKVLTSHSTVSNQISRNHITTWSRPRSMPYRTGRTGPVSSLFGLELADFEMHRRSILTK